MKFSIYMLNIHVTFMKKKFFFSTHLTALDIQQLQGFGTLISILYLIRASTEWLRIGTSHRVGKIKSTHAIPWSKASTLTCAGA